MEPWSRGKRGVFAFGGSGGPRGGPGPNSPRVGNTSSSRTRGRRAERLVQSCESGLRLKQRDVVSLGVPFSAGSRPPPPPPPPFGWRRDGGALNSLRTGTRPAGPVLWAWKCYPAERPGGLKLGLREGGWRPVEVGLLPAKRPGCSLTCTIGGRKHPVRFCSA